MTGHATWIVTTRNRTWVTRHHWLVRLLVGFTVLVGHTHADLPVVRLKPVSVPLRSKYNGIEPEDAVRRAQHREAMEDWS